MYNEIRWASALLAVIQGLCQGTRYASCTLIVMSRDVDMSICGYAEKVVLTALVVCAGSEVDLSRIGNTAKSGAVLAPEIELDKSPIPSRVTAPAQA